MLVAAAYEAWLEDKQRTVAASTIANYEHIGRNYILPLFGHLDVSEVTRDHFLDRLEEITLGQQPRVKGCLAQCLDWTQGASCLAVRSVRLRSTKPSCPYASC